MRISRRAQLAWLGGAIAAGCASRPPDCPTDVYLLIGQSNMAGRGEVEAIDRMTHPRVISMNAHDEWETAREPLHFDKPERVGVGPGLAFGKAMADADPDRIVGLVPCAVGGSVIATWTQGGYHAQTGVYPYDDAIRRARLAMRRGRLRAILWHQGEYDSTEARAPLYRSELVRLAGSLRRDLDATDAPILVGGLGEFYRARNSFAVVVNETLSQAPSFIARCGFVPADGLGDRGDQLHFSAPAARELGCRYAAALLALEERERPR